MQNGWMACGAPAACHARGWVKAAQRGLPWLLLRGACGLQAAPGWPADPLALPGVRHELAGVVHPQDSNAGGSAAGPMPGRVWLNQDFSAQTLRAVLDGNPSHERTHACQWAPFVPMEAWR